MDNQSILVFTFGETAYRLGTQLKEKNPRGFIVTSFMHPKDNLKGQCVVTYDKEDFGVAFGNCLTQNEQPLSCFALAWRWLTRKPQKTERKLVIVAGLGGKYSSEYAPMAAQIAHERGYQVMAVVQLPFRFEGQKRCQRAEDALRLLEKHTEEQVVFNHSVLAPKYRDMSAYDYFNKVDDLTMEAVLRQG